MRKKHPKIVKLPSEALLQEAVHILDSYSSRLEQNSRQNPLKTTIDLISTVFSEKKRTRELEELEHLNDAIKVLQRSFMLVAFLQKGTPQQRQLANAAINAIRKYNALVLEKEQYPSSFPERIKLFLSSKNPLDKINYFPKTLLEVVHAGGQSDPNSKRTVTVGVQCPTDRKIADLPSLAPPLFHPMHQLPAEFVKMAGLFELKVIKNVEDLEKLSPQEAREVFAKAFMYAPEVNQDSATISLSCTLKPFPGHTIYVQGLFDNNPKSPHYSMPIKEGFKFTSIYNPTGFPHPSQSTGAGFPNFLPPYPHHPSEMPELRQLILRKQEISSSLIPQKPQLKIAKLHYVLRRAAFEANKETFFELHKNFSMALIESAGNLTEKNIPPVQNFFDSLAKHFEENIPTRLLGRTSNAFDYLSDTHWAVIDSFYNHPYESLQNSWIEQALVVDDLKQGCDCVSVFLNTQTQQMMRKLEDSRDAAKEIDRARLDYIICLGRSLSQAWRQIILQQFSENVPYCPPELTIEEQTFQAAACRQLRWFIDGIEKGLPNTVEEAAELMQEQLKSLKHMLKTHDLQGESEYPQELDSYYKVRYWINSSQKD